MDIVGTKILVMVLTSVIPIFLSLLPLWFKSYLVPSKNQKSSWRAVVTSMLLCFGGGVLLATSLVHLLPEVLCYTMIFINEDMQENTWARLRDSHPGMRAIHAT